MFKVRLADLVIGIDNQYEYIRDMCAEYIADEPEVFTVSADEAELDREIESGIYDRGYLESLALYRKIAERLIYFDGFLMHCAVLDTEKGGVAFCARSGVGKTTHIRLWKQLFSDKVSIVNGDKPLIRFIDGIPYAYGTPWSGKEGYNINMRTRLSDICILSRSEENRICGMPAEIAVKKLMYQIYLPDKPADMLKTLELLDSLLGYVKVWDIGCNMDITAAKTVYEGIFGE